jgi:hypothetical protein
VADRIARGLAAARDWTQNMAMSSLAMKRFVVAALWACWAPFCGFESNTVPLAFGMTPDQASTALGVPLVYHSGRGGSETYVAHGSAGVPGFYPVDSALALQFRKGHLTGWTKEWRLRRPWPF